MAKTYKKQGKESNLPDNNPEIKQSSNLLTTEEAAEYLKLKPNTLERCGHNIRIGCRLLKSVGR